MITKKLAEIQAKLKAPKNQRNNFGGYNYRSCEDILEAVKPLLGEACLTVSDDIILIGDRFYIKATAKLSLGDQSIENSAFAREPLTKKGMDEAQITGATSSYARKYALNGLFAIDDTKDPDATNTHGKEDEDFKKTATAEKTATTKAILAAAKTGDTNVKLPAKNKTVDDLKRHFQQSMDFLSKVEGFDKLSNSQIDFINNLCVELFERGLEVEHEQLTTLFNKVKSEHLDNDEVKF
jgi:hypothetical protein